MAPDLDFSLSGKVVIVSGASPGLGVSFAAGFARAGAHLVPGARRVDKLEATRQTVMDSGVECIAVATDVAKARGLRRLSRPRWSGSAVSTCS